MLLYPIAPTTVVDQDSPPARDKAQLLEVLLKKFDAMSSALGEVLGVAVRPGLDRP